MKRKGNALIAAALALSLTIPAVTGPDSDAKAKAPKLTPKNGATIITGKTKTFKIKNVKAKNVKSLKVDVAAKSVATLVSKKKTSFVVKAIGGGWSDLNVTLKLKKKQAGKKTYKFSGLNLMCGSEEHPEISLTDEVTKVERTALVLKAGTADDSKDNRFNLIVKNTDAIGPRNMMVRWYESKKEIVDWCGECTGGTYQHWRPKTADIKITAPVTGSAAGVSGSATAVSGPAAFPATGSGAIFHPISPVSEADKGLLIEKIYQAKVENLLSEKSTISNPKLVRIVSQSYIDDAVRRFEEFAKKYPYKSVSELPTTREGALAYMDSFKTLAHALGMTLGMTNKAIEYVNKEFHTGDVRKVAKDVLKSVGTELVNVGKYLGIKEEVATAYVKHLDYIGEKSLTDRHYSLAMLHYK